MDDRYRTSQSLLSFSACSLASSHRSGLPKNRNWSIFNANLFSVPSFSVSISNITSVNLCFMKRIAILTLFFHYLTLFFTDPQRRVTHSSCSKEWREAKERSRRRQQRISNADNSLSSSTSAIQNLNENRSSLSKEKALRQHHPMLWPHSSQSPSNILIHSNKKDPKKRNVRSRPRGISVMSSPTTQEPRYLHLINVSISHQRSEASGLKTMFSLHSKNSKSLNQS